MHAGASFLTCGANEPDAGASGAVGRGHGAVGVARRVLLLLLHRRWLDVDAVTGRDPYKLLALLVVLGSGIYALQRLFIKGFLPRPWTARNGDSSSASANSTNTSTRTSAVRVVPEAEEQRVGEKCVRIFLHRVRLLICLFVCWVDADVIHIQNSNRTLLNPPNPPHSAFW